MADKRAGSSRRLVIDASVAQAAGGTGATFPRSARCRDFLQAVVRICHRAVMTPAVREEWNRHESRFFLTWRRSMEARKKIVRDIDDVACVSDEQLAAALPSQKRLAAARKDVHLLNAAVAADQVVISLDEEARTDFKSVAGRCHRLGTVCWANPAEQPDGAVGWLEDGAPPKPEWMLSARRGKR